MENKMDRHYQLPKDFFFGAAMSGPQTEGAHNIDGKLPSVWDHWSDLEINAFFNNVGSYVGNDFYNRYEEDIKLLKSLNFKSFRTSIQWSRLLDCEGKLNPKGAEFYHKVIQCAKENDIEVFMNLHHFDLPQYWEDRGGWTNREVIEAFGNFVKIALKEFGHEVNHWFTFNEPIVVPMQMYMHGGWYPYEKNMAKAMTVQYHITIAHSLAVREFKKLKEKGEIPKTCDIGLINCFSPPYTKENPSQGDLEAVRMTDGLHNRWWLDVCSKGKLPQDVLDTLTELDICPDIRPGDEDLLACGTVDWLGFNYYQPVRVQEPVNRIDKDGNVIFADSYIWPERKMNVHRGWEIYPQGIYDFAMKIKVECPGLPFFVSENGMGVEGEEKFKDENGCIHDDYRIEFVRDHLIWIAKAIEDGADCRGYHYWGAIDNWSWANAFKNRYGFICVDLADKYNRKRKTSANWIQEVAKDNIIR